MRFDENGHEVLDPTPVAIPVGFRRPPSLQEMIRQYVRRELSQQAAAEGHETFEEADDFDVGDDYDPRSPWELDFDQEHASHEAAAGVGAGDPGGSASPSPSPQIASNQAAPAVEDGANAGVA